MNRKITFGLTRGISDNVEESRSVGFILSTFAKDRHGTVLNQDNWQIENFRKNPVVGYQHNLSGGLLLDPNPDYIIGKDINPRIEGTGKDRKLTGIVQFEPADINPMAEKIFRKVLFGSLSKASVGFIEIGIGHYGTGKEARGEASETYYFEGQELIEWSIVNIPSNAEAGKRKIRTLQDASIGAVCYAANQLGSKFRPGELEKLSIDDILILLEGKDLDIKEKDPAKVRKMLTEPLAVNDRIELERLAFRKAQEARKLLQEGTKQVLDKEQNNFKTQKNSTMKKKLLLQDAINAHRNNQKFSKDWLDVFAKANDDMRLAGMANLPGRAQLVIPIMDRATIEDDGSNTGTSPLYALPSAGDLTTMAKAGATVITGFIGNVKVPSPLSVTAGWLGQTAQNQNNAGDLNSIPLSPLRMQAWFDVSSLVLSMGGHAAEDYLVGLLIAATAEKLEATILGAAARSAAVQPQGIFYKVTSGTSTKKAAVVPTFDDILAMEQEVATLKALQGNLAYITSGKGKKILKTTKKESGFNESLLEKGIMNDRPVFISNWASDIAGSDGLGSGLVFGNWSDLLIVQFGAYMLTVDNLSQARYAKIRIFVDSFWDVKGMRFPSSSTGTGTDNDEYAGFASLPIK